jgi:hypothetical protein
VTSNAEAFLKTIPHVAFRARYKWDEINSKRQRDMSLLVILLSTMSRAIINLRAMSDLPVINEEVQVEWKCRALQDIAGW